MVHDYVMRDRTALYAKSFDLRVSAADHVRFSGFPLSDLKLVRSFRTADLVYFTAEGGVVVVVYTASLSVRHREDR